jgi:urease accessory protein
VSSPVPIAPGELTVHVTADAAGRTRVTSLRQRYPQRVTAPLHCDPDHPNSAVLCVQSPSGGAFSDDDLHTAVHCAAGTHLQLTTQAATQVFAGDGSGARHQLRFKVATDAVLEYWPKTIIPQSDSAFTQKLDVEVDPGGVYLGWEAVSAGRIAHGERFRYARYDNAFEVGIAGRVVARDRQVIQPARTALDPALVDGDYIATFLTVLPGRPADRALRRVRAVLDELAGVCGGAGELPGGSGVIARITSRTAPELHRARQALHETVRTELLSAATTYGRSA